jgi:hypothetical protein
MLEVPMIREVGKLIEKTSLDRKRTMNEEIVDYRGYIKTLTSLSELYLEAQKAWDIGSTKFIPALSKRIQELKRRILEELPKL